MAACCPPNLGLRPFEVLCLACDMPGTPLEMNFTATTFMRRELKDGDVLIDVKYCGVCHTDQIFARGAFQLPGQPPPTYPCVPGHEVGGVCVAVGPNVTKFKIGDKVGVGCMVDACLKCKACLVGEEQMCASFSTGTYGALDAHGRVPSRTPRAGRRSAGTRKRSWCTSASRSRSRRPTRSRRRGRSCARA